MTDAEAILFESVERLVKHPYQDIIDRARELQADLRSFGADTADQTDPLYMGLVADATAELDAMWGNRRYEKALLTGKLLTAASESQGDVNEFSVQSYEVISNGFCFTQHKGEIVPCHHLYVETVDDDLKVVHQAVLAPLFESDVTLPDYEEPVTIEDLTYFYDDTLGEIDGLIMNATDRAEAISALGHLDDSVVNDLDDEGKEALLKYLEIVLPLQRNLPSVLSGMDLLMTIQKNEDDEPIFAYQSAKNMVLTAYPHRFLYVPSYYCVGNTAVVRQDHRCLAMEVAVPVGDNETSLVIVPIKQGLSVIDLEAVRFVA